MEAIRNYLESMFMNLPNTPEVQKAKFELGQMMEDKYTELMNDGKAENEAVGIVISEFGNLEELAADLGIGAFMNRGEQVMRRSVSINDVKSYLTDKMKQAYMIALGVLLCITCPVLTIMCSSVAHEYDLNSKTADALGVFFLFAFIAAAVGLFVFSGMKMQKWDYLKNQPCSIDFGTAEFVHNQKEGNKAMHALLITLGVILCILSVVPSAVIGCLDYDNGIVIDFSGALVLIMVAVGVFMFIMAGVRDEGYNTILKLNGSGTVGGNYVPSQNDDVKYSNKTVAAIMSVYWPTITCIYLIWSFLTFDWHITWIVWPVAGVISGLMKNLFGEK